MLIAQVAYDHLTPETKKEVDRLCQHDARSPYSEIRFDKAATWMDAIKDTGLHAFNTWHYTTRPYAPTNFPVPKIYQPKDARWALHKSINILKNPVADDLEKAFMLRVLAHVAGDVHQPLHVMSLFDKAFPKGDQGGNLFTFPVMTVNEQKLTSLHSTWDFACGEFPVLDMSDPKQLKETLPKLAKLLEERWPREELEAEITTSVSDWFNESYTLGVENAYNFQGSALKTGVAPNEAYLENCQDVCRKRIAVAGYRLAALLNEIFGHKGAS